MFVCVCELPRPSCSNLNLQISGLMFFVVLDAWTLKPEQLTEFHHHGQKEGFISFATNLFQSTRFVDESALPSNKVHS